MTTLVFTGSGNYTLDGSNVTSTGGTVFTVVKSGNTVTITGQSGYVAAVGRSWNVFNPVPVKNSITTYDADKPIVDISVQGAGNVLVNPTPLSQAMSVTINGAANVDLGSSVFAKLTLLVSGAGNISRFHVNESVRATVSGCGNVTGTAAKQATVVPTMSGVGSIKISRV